MNESSLPVSAQNLLFRLQPMIKIMPVTTAFLLKKFIGPLGDTDLKVIDCRRFLTAQSWICRFIVAAFLS